MPYRHQFGRDGSSLGVTGVVETSMFEALSNPHLDLEV